MSADTPGGQLASLTPREVEVLRLLALAHTNREIAEILSIAPRTVEAHRIHVLQKLGARTRAQLVRVALDAGLLES
jgi:two-component system response regulator NreC